MMPTRVEQLGEAMQGLLQTGIPLVAATSHGLAPAATSDDIGLYLFAPQLARLLSIDVLAAANCILLAVLFLSAVVGYLGFWRMSGHPASWLYSAVVVGLLTYAALRIGDVYVVSAAVPLAILPWALHFLKRHAGPYAWVGFMLAVGVVSGLANLLRSHSATPVLLFLLIALLLSRILTIRWRAVLACLLVSSFLLTLLVMTAPIHARDAYLATRISGYTEAPSGHPFWHSIYIGFGYVPNDVVPQYLDEVAISTVDRIRPGTEYLSPEYEQVLAEEVFRLITTRPALALKVTGAKLLVVLLHLALALNVSIVLLARRKGLPPVALMYAFCAAIAFASLSGLLVVPNPNYLLGMHSTAGVFAALVVALSLDPAAQQSLADGIAGVAGVEYPETKV